MKNLNNVYYSFMANLNRKLEQKKDQEYIDIQRRKMLNVNPDARLATAFGATFVI